MQKAIVLHSDILGFKEIIEKAESDTKDETLNKLKDVLGQSFEILKMFKTLEDQTNNQIRYKLFSDNLYASVSYEEGNKESFDNAFITAIIFARAYFENMLNNQIAVRGGISFGNDYSDETLIFSMALVKAYTLESKRAIYPRIIIDNELIAQFNDSLSTPSEYLLEIMNNSILFDNEKVFFINPSGMTIDFRSEINGLKGQELDKRYIEQNIRFAQDAYNNINTETDEGKHVANKYKWLIEILNWNYNDRKDKPPFGDINPKKFAN